jgi:hypothetical protein
VESQALIAIDPAALPGCRPGETASMRWSDLRIEEACVVLKEHKTARKTGLPRVIPLVPTTIKLLLWMKSRHPSGSGAQSHVFTNGRGKRPQSRMAVTQDAAAAPASGAAAGRHALWAAPPLRPDGDQERRESEAAEPVHGTPPNPADGALHRRGGTDGPGAKGRTRAIISRHELSFSPCVATRLERAG